MREEFHKNFDILEANTGPSEEGRLFWRAIWELALNGWPEAHLELATALRVSYI